jgi:formylmethanofuran dehydrogenase subunit B
VTGSSVTGSVVPPSAIEAAADLLLTARLPLVWGLVGSTVEAQREAVRIADRLRGVIDTAASAGQAGAQAAFERQGVLTASLGEVKRRANLVVFWGCDPGGAHPGFVDRYAPARPGRTRISVDVGPALGPDGVDERVALPAGREIEALVALRAFVRGRRVEAERARVLGLPLDPLRRLARQLAGCGYGAILVDADLPAERRDPERAGALGALVRDARGRARLRLLGVRGPGNPVGAESVLTWQTGFPGAVSFASGAPRYGPGEWTGEAVLARGEVDAALIVGADAKRFLSAAGLRRLPTVLVAAPDAPGFDRATVSLATAPFAATAGHVFRMDGVALRQRPASAASVSGGPSDLPTEAEALKELAAAIEARATETPGLSGVRR